MDERRPGPGQPDDEWTLDYWQMAREAGAFVLMFVLVMVLAAHLFRCS